MVGPPRGLADDLRLLLALSVSDRDLLSRGDGILISMGTRAPPRSPADLRGGIDLACLDRIRSRLWQERQDGQPRVGCVPLAETAALSGESGPLRLHSRVTHGTFAAGGEDFQLDRRTHSVHWRQLVRMAHAGATQRLVFSPGRAVSVCADLRRRRCSFLAR